MNKLKIGILRRGFTLIEMLVAIGIFAVVMTMAMAAFLNVTDLQAKTESFRKVNDNLNFAMEAMMREIREGYYYKCDDVDCVDDGNTNNNISFTLLDPDGNEKTIKYEKSGDFITRDDGSGPTQITSDSVIINNLFFVTKGVGTGDAFQPLVTISITAVSGKKTKLKSTLNIQTTVSQRKLDTGYAY